MKMYLARHTRTNYNDLRLCNADPSADVHLTEVGLQQAEELALKLKYISFEKILISELPRTRQTAEIINQYHCVPIEVHAQLTEHATGFEGQPYEMYWEALDAAPDKYNYKGPNGGESLNHLRQRVTEFLDELKQSGFQAVMVVAHETVIQWMVGVLDDLSNDDAGLVTVLHGDFRTIDL